MSRLFQSVDLTGDSLTVYDNGDGTATVMTCQGNRVQSIELDRLDLARALVPDGYRLVQDADGGAKPEARPLLVAVEGGKVQTLDDDAADRIVTRLADRLADRLDGTDDVQPERPAWVDAIEAEWRSAERKHGQRWIGHHTWWHSTSALVAVEEVGEAVRAVLDVDQTAAAAEWLQAAACALDRYLAATRQGHHLPAE